MPNHCIVHMKISYFILAILLVGSMGVWVPALHDYDEHNTMIWHSIPLNLGTYYIAMLFGGSIEHFLSKYRRIDLDGVGPLFLNILWVLVLSVGSFLFLNRCYNKGDDFTALFIGIVGTVGAWIMWWTANEDNPNFASRNAETGGNPNRPLSTGK